ncbi:hypothetical protein JI739_11120 [Ramlibacter sp. AW1]|uniref:DUF4148 domain-containing protein n=1 Tax=Ramlibacter aurantiacus TaxID=2801330 RepID=A0A936ZHA2_9BURK|nr:hypothetical protein [Ramlibacter aurantiacus]MBL0420897.1 hypothetical protein [Ramlibacter aurantiacus]
MQHIRSILAPAFAVAALAVSGYAVAQNNPTSPSGTGSVSSDAEVRRGVPGVDMDVNTRDRGARAGVPGVDVDVRNTRNQMGDNDTRRAGAGAAGTTAGERMRADRN